MKHMKKAICFIMIILIAIGACGCMNGQNKTTLSDKMIEYMNKKYPDDTFYLLESYGGGASADKKVIIVNSKKYADKEIYVSCSVQDNVEIFSDNYLGVLYESQVRELLANSLEKYFDANIYLSYTANKFACPNESGTMTFEEYVSDFNSNIGLTCVIFGDCDNRNNIAANLEKIFVDAGICCYGTVYFDKIPSNLSTINEIGLSNYLNKNTYECSFFFRMEDNNSFSKSKWSE